MGLLVAAHLLAVGDMSLPITLPYELLVTRWANEIDPVLAIPMLKGLAITNISLLASTPKTISTGLNRVQQGWFLTDNTAFCQVKRTAAFNSFSLTLESDADTTISIWVY